MYYATKEEHRFRLEVKILAHVSCESNHQITTHLIIHAKFPLPTHSLLLVFLVQ